MPRQCCSQCLRPLPVCYCSQITPLCNHRSVVILQDIQEASHALGTARIAALSLNRCELLTLDPDAPAEPSRWQGLLRQQPALIYPGESARDIGELAAQPAVPLLFIDASWRRSRRILHTQAWLAELPRYCLHPDTVSRYRIRQQPTESALSTLEAIVHSLKQLDPQPEQFDSLLATMDWMVDQQIKYMGDAVWQGNYLNRRK